MSILLRRIGAAELALRLVAHRGRGDFCALVVDTASGDDVERAATELSGALSTIGGAGATRVRSSSDAVALAAELHAATGPAVVTGLDDWPEAEWQHLDEIRSRLQRDERTVLVLSAQAFERLVACAPNLGSWVAAAWTHVPDVERLTEEERERRLAALRAWSGMTDEEMLDRRRRGVLPPDPQYSLWLILLGRGDLLASGHE